MERYVGWVKHRLNARNLAVESLTENAKLFESYKLFFKEGFAEGHSTSSGNDSDVEETEIVEEAFSLLHYVGAWSVNGPTPRRWNLKGLLADYVTRAKNVAAGAASSCISGDMIEVYCHALVPCDDHLHEVGAWETKRDGAKRSHFFCSEQYASATRCNGRDVYYGRVSLLFKYAFEFAEGIQRHSLFAGEWGRDLRKTHLNQVYAPHGWPFGQVTVEDISILLNPIGVTTDTYPADAYGGVARGTRLFFIDPCAKSYAFLRKGGRPRMA
ncbi:hypothetical protein BWQ96_07407 [Gracilariopsis chorda]|uniref:Uncharacterized protein n=1 Tax=Gracilariopsis chorda TaxID=448386 RepID=A0A2V3ILC4_9FLOR|nr:hypothetical protein BWQ96_07407 [Gracilariopsis chorda]|eukprot:PXF42863.1 hypothetical protein BWQ96_07407 [Gracilariopsis chorda]